MINYSEYDPRIFPINGDVAPAEIDRAQSIDPSTDLSREKINEIGNDSVVGYRKGIPEVTYSLTQLEYGSFEFWRKIANKIDSVTDLTLNDFQTSEFDIVAYLTDNDGTFRGSMLYPKLRVNGFTFSIGDPESDAERTFDFIGESAIQFQGDNKYYIYERHEAGSASDNVIDLSARVPAVLPDEDISGASDAEKYMFRVLRVRGTATTELDLSTDATYNTGTNELTITSIQTGDVIKVFYTSATAPAVMWEANTTDEASINADSVIIEIGRTSMERAYRIQNIDLDVAFERTDEGEIGNKEKVLRGISDKTVTITLGRFLEDFDIEEILRGAGAGYGQLDFDKLATDITITVKVYADDAHTQFKYGLQATNLTPSSVDGGADVLEFTEREWTLEGEELLITSNEGSL